MLKTIARVELLFSEVIAGATPWLAPFPTAYSVYVSGEEGLGWPWWVAIIAAAAIEGLGVSAANTAMTLYSYQQEKRKSDADAENHLHMAIAASVLYLGSALILISLTEVQGQVGLRRFVPIVFPFIGLAAMIILALRTDHKRRLLGIEEGKQDKRRASAVQQSASAVQSAQPAQKFTYADYASAQQGSGELMNADEICTRFNVSRRTAYNWLSKHKSEVQE